MTVIDITDLPIKDYPYYLERGFELRVLSDKAVMVRKRGLVSQYLRKLRDDERVKKCSLFKRQAE